MKKFPINFLRLAFTSLFVLFAGILFSQTAMVSPPSGGFKIDGILRANITPNGTTTVGDWIPKVNGTAFTGGVDNWVISSAGVPKDPVTTKLESDKFNETGDDIFTQGSKFNDAIGALHWGTGGAPNKNDIHRGMFHAAGDADDNQWVFIAGDRLDVSGTSYIDFQFLQGTVVPNTTANTFTGSGPCGGRTVNDINVSMEYNNGGSAPKVVVYRWEPTNDAGTAGTWAIISAASIPDAFAQTNLANADVPFGAFNLTSYQPFAFVEAAINVTQLISALGENCAGLNIKTLWITTKASSSPTAALKDFIKPISVDLNFGGVSITAQQPVCASAPNITLSGSPSGGTFSGSFVTAGGVFSPTDAGAGTHTVTYTASAGVNCLKTASIDIVVNPNPTVSVNSPTKCASDPAVNITATPGSGVAADYDYAWSVPPGVPAPGNVPNFTANVAGNYTVVITNKTTGCVSAAAQGTLLVNASPDQPNVTVVQPTCGNSNGTVTVTSPVDGGGNDYEYKNNSGSYQESPVFTVAAGAAYSIVVRNKATGCVSLARAGNMGSAAGAPDAKAVITQDVSCSNSIGTVKIVQNVAGTVEFSATDFEFSSNNSTWVSNPEFTFTAGGGYHLYVRRKADHTCVDDVECVAAAGKNSSNTESEVTARSLGSATLEESTVTVKATPNPFSNQVRFTISNPEAGSGTLDIYNMTGQKIKTVYEGHIPEGVSFFDLKVATKQVANLVYVLRIGDKKTTGKLLQINR